MHTSMYDQTLTIMDVNIPVLHLILKQKSWRNNYGSIIPTSKRPHGYWKMNWSRIHKIPDQFSLPHPKPRAQHVLRSLLLMGITQSFHFYWLINYYCFLLIHCPPLVWHPYSSYCAVLMQQCKASWLCFYISRRFHAHNMTFVEEKRNYLLT